MAESAQKIELIANSIGAGDCPTARTPAAVATVEVKKSPAVTLAAPASVPVCAGSSSFVVTFLYKATPGTTLTPSVTASDPRIACSAVAREGEMLSVCRLAAQQQLLLAIAMF